MKKILAVFFAVMMLCFMGACVKSPNGPSDGNDFEYNVEGPNKTVIKVTNFNGGVGSIWLQKAAEEFAKQNQNTHFADGKTGVYVDLNLQMGVAQLVTNCENQPQDVFFTESQVDISTLVESGKLLDITSVVKDETRVGGALEDSIFQSAKGTIMNSDGKYFALPHYEFYGGLAYNREVFEECNALIADKDCDQEFIYNFDGIYGGMNFVLSDSINEEGCVLSKGPDGEYGTEDDGLPCSIEEFVILLDYFKNEKSVMPVVLSGQWNNMVNYLIDGLWASLAGQKQMANYYNLNGEIEVVDDFTDEPLISGIDYVKKPVTKIVNITPENAYLGNDMAAKYYALALAEIIQKEGFYAEKELTGNTSHTAAQRTLIFSGNENAVSAAKTTKVAMLIDGSYWWNESRDAGNFVEYQFLGNTTEEVDLRWMALPTTYTTAQHDDPSYEKRASCLMDIAFSYCVVNNRVATNEEVKSACLEFIKFCYSDAQLKEFTKTTGITRAVKYELSNEEVQTMPSFYQRLWKLRDNLSGSNVAYFTTKEGADATTKATFKRAASAIQIRLSSPNLLPTDPFVATSVYGIYNSSKNELEGGVYKYGSQYMFNALKIMPDVWRTIYTVGV